jgi:sulfotransferase
MTESTAPFPLLPFTSQETIRKCLHLEESNSLKTLFIASYPKSGTTWMQAIIFHLLSSGQIPLQHISLFSPFYELNATWNEHDDRICTKYSNNHELLGWRVFNTHLLPSMLPKGDSVQYIYVYRNGRDVAISFFHHLSNQVSDGVAVEDIKQFLTDWSNGKLPFGSWIQHLRCWMTKIDDLLISNILLVRYEDLKNDLHLSITRISKFLNHSVTDTRLEELTALLSFESMKGSKSLYEPVSVQWKEGFEFLRKGTVGDSKEYFGADEELLISSMLDREFPDGVPDWFSSLGLL